MILDTFRLNASHFNYLEALVLPYVSAIRKAPSRGWQDKKD